MAAADHGWRLLRLADLLRALESHQSRALRILYRLDPSMRPAFEVTLRSGQVDTLHREGVAIGELAEQMDALLDALPEGEPIPVTYDDARASAERLLRDGDTVDATAILLAAHLLDRTTGLAALAQGLRASGAYTAWAETTVGGLLGAFRGVSPQLVRRIATAARMAPGTEIAGRHADEIAQLADQLDLHA